MDTICQQSCPNVTGVGGYTDSLDKVERAMRAGLTRLLEQGPRVRRVAVLAFVAGVLLYLDKPGLVGGLPVPLFAGLLYAGLITPAAAITAAFLPALAALSDAVQLARLGFAAAVVAMPGLMRPLADQPLINATIVVLGGTAVLSASRNRSRIAAFYKGGISPAARTS